MIVARAQPVPVPLLVLAVVAAGFVVYRWVDLARSDSVRYLPKWALGDHLRRVDSHRRRHLPGGRKEPLRPRPRAAGKRAPSHIPIEVQRDHRCAC